MHRHNPSCLFTHPLLTRHRKYVEEKEKQNEKYEVKRMRKSKRKK
jgi:hypothetical protein